MRYHDFSSLSVLVFFLVTGCVTQIEPAGVKVLSEPEYARVARVLNDSGLRSYLYVYGANKAGAEEFEGILLSRDLGEMKGLGSNLPPVGYHTLFDSGDGALVTLIEVPGKEHASVGSLSMLSNDRKILMIDTDADGVSEAAIGIVRSAIEWSIVDRDYRELLPCLESGKLADLDACFPELPPTDADSGGIAGGIRDEAANWGEPRCTGESDESRISDGADGDGDSADLDNDHNLNTESEWRETERQMRTRARHHRERAASLRKDPARNAAKIRRHEEAAVAADAAADGAEAQIPRERGTPEYEAGSQNYDRARVDSDRATGRAYPNERGDMDWYMQETYRNDRPRRGSEPRPGQTVPGEDPRCRTRKDLFSCGADLKSCVERLQDPVRDITDGGCWKEEGPAGGTFIRCADNEERDERCDDPATSNSCDFGVPRIGAEGIGGSILDLMPLGDVILGLPRRGGGVDPRPDL